MARGNHPSVLIWAIGPFLEFFPREGAFVLRFPPVKERQTGKKGGAYV